MDIVSHLEQFYVWASSQPVFIQIPIGIIVLSAFCLSIALIGYIAFVIIVDPHAPRR